MGFLIKPLPKHICYIELVSSYGLRILHKEPSRVEVVRDADNLIFDTWMLGETEWSKNLARHYSMSNEQFVDEMKQRLSRVLLDTRDISRMVKSYDGYNTLFYISNNDIDVLGHFSDIVGQLAIGL